MKTRTRIARRSQQEWKNRLITRMIELIYYQPRLTERKLWSSWLKFIDFLEVTRYSDTCILCSRNSGTSCSAIVWNPLLALRSWITTTVDQSKYSNIRKKVPRVETNDVGVVVIAVGVSVLSRSDAWSTQLYQTIYASCLVLSYLTRYISCILYTRSLLSRRK